MKKLLRCSLLGLLLLCSVVVNGAQVPKYIFLFIGDGMGFNHVEATQIYAEKVGTDTGECSLLFPTFPVMTQVCTRSASHLITCSSAAATALATGEKTTNYVIGMDAEKNHGLKSLARQLKDKEQRIIISGDADCISNTELTLSREGYRSGNFNLIIESFRWLSGGEFPIDIRRPHCTDNKLSIGVKDIGTMKTIFIIIIPAILLLIGVGIWFFRRRN